MNFIKVDVPHVLKKEKEREICMCVFFLRSEESFQHSCCRVVISSHPLFHITRKSRHMYNITRRLENRRILQGWAWNAIIKRRRPAFCSCDFALIEPEVPSLKENPLIAREIHPLPSSLVRRWESELLYEKEKLLEKEMSTGNAHDL